MTYETIFSLTHLFVMCFTFDVGIAQYCKMTYSKTHGAHGKPIKYIMAIFRNYPYGEIVS